MARVLPPMSALRAFEATTRLGSVTRAAEELGRTHGAVSRQLKSLQDQAGVALFEKAGTGLRLNPQGEALRAGVATALDGLEQTWRDVLAEAHGPGLHVACSATFAMRWLVPRLSGFYRRHPAVQIRLSMTSAREIRHQGADLVIAWDRVSYPARDEARAIRLGDVAFGPVCVPDYPVEVAAGRLGIGTRIAHEFTSRAWDVWQANAGISVAAGAELRFPHTHLCLEAALAGLGVALVERRQVRDELAAGRLHAPCGFTPFADGIAAIPTSTRADTVAGRAFVGWLRESLAE